MKTVLVLSAGVALAVGVASARQSTPALVGAQACAACHGAIHDMWTDGRHSRMLQPATAAAVEGDFSKTAITLKGHRYGLRVTNGEYFISESELTGREQEHRVDYTLGSRRIQHYLTTIDRGQIVVLAPTWDVQRGEWFHNTDIIRPDEDDRVVMQQWNKSCVGCHVSGQEQRYDPATHTYATRWTDFGTTCERCHGPGQLHASQPSTVDSRPSFSVARRQSIVRPTRLDPKGGTAVCAQCHSLRTAINPGYTAGADYDDFFVPVLEYAPYARPHASQDPPYWADGRPRRFSNDAIGLWQSACYLRGGLTCTTCHTNPHLPDVDRNPQLAPAASNTVCIRCHQAIGAGVAAHTRHRADGPGSACVDCHMPKTVASIKAAMRDHTIGVPAPENTVAFGIPNACTTGCHADKPASWAVDVLKSWRPDGRRRRLVAQAEAFAAARAGRREAIEPLLAIAGDETYGPLTRANALGYLGAFDDPRALAGVVRASSDSDAVIRTTAVAALRRPALRADAGARAAALAALRDPKRTVRIASLLTIVDQANADMPPADLDQFRRVAAELAEWTGANQDDADLQRVEGIVRLLTGDFPRAASALGISFDLQPDAPSVRFFLAMARLGEHRVDAARALLKDVPSSDPYYAKAQEQLKKVR